MWLFGLLLLGVWGVAEELKLSADAKKKSKLQLVRLNKAINVDKIATFLVFISNTIIT